MGNTESAAIPECRSDSGCVYHAEIPVNEPPLCNSRSGPNPGSVRGLNPVRDFVSKVNSQLMESLLNEVKIDKIEGAGASFKGREESDPCDIIFQFTNREPDYSVSRKVLVNGPELMEDFDKSNISWVNYVAHNRLKESGMYGPDQRFTVYRYNLILYEDYVIVKIHSNSKDPEKLRLWYMFAFAGPMAVWLQLYRNVIRTNCFTVLERGYPSKAHAYGGSFVKEIVLFIKANNHAKN